MKKGKLKNALINLGLIMLSFAAILLLSEFVFRMALKKTMWLFPRYQTDVKYGDFTIRRVIPNMTYTHRSYDGSFDFVSNNKGFRNTSDIEYKKDSDDLRILFLGDSHTIGMEVKQSQVWTTVVENLFKEKKMKVTAINTGCIGFGTAEECVLLENEGYKYHPDYVVLGFYCNDFKNNMMSALYKVENDSLKINSYRYTPGTDIQNIIYKFKVFNYLGENSYLYSYFFNTIWVAIKDFRFKKKISDAKKDVSLEYADEEKPEISNKEILLMGKLISEMYTFCKNNKMNFIIVDIPQHNLNSSIPKELVAQFKNNCDTLFYAPDLKTEFQRLPKVHVKYGHRHISEETHALFAKKIADYVLEQTNKQTNLLTP